MSTKPAVDTLSIVVEQLQKAASLVAGTLEQIPNYRPLILLQSPVIGVRNTLDDLTVVAAALLDAMMQDEN